MLLKAKIILSGLLLLVLLAIVVVFLKTRTQYGSVEIIFQLPTTQHISATINSNPLSITRLDATYKLAVGEKKLAVTKSNYRSLSVSFSVTKGQTVIINVVMQPLAQTAQPVATARLSDSLATLVSPGTTLQQATYFYNNTWVVATISSGGNTAVLVAEYKVSSNTWNLVLGPGTLFDSNSLKGLPPSIVSYMYAQNYATEGRF